MTAHVHAMLCIQVDFYFLFLWFLTFENMCEAFFFSGFGNATFHF